MSPPPKKPALLPPSKFSEPSEPSQLKAYDPEKPASQLTSSQEENPQLIAHEPPHHATQNGGGNVKDDEDEAAGRELEQAREEELEGIDASELETRGEDHHGLLDAVKKKLSIGAGKVKGKL